MRIRFFQNCIDKIRGKGQLKKVLCQPLSFLDYEFIKPNFEQLVSIRGFYYSGSSVLIDLFREFADVSVLGYTEDAYSKSSVCDCGEISFFTDPRSIYNLAFNFKYGNELQQDLSIKQFIELIYYCYDNKTTRDAIESNNVVYNDDFLASSLDFLFEILDLTDATISKIKRIRFPVVFNSSDDCYFDCNFMQCRGISQYLFYRFKNISDLEFNTCIRKYIYTFFSHISSKKILVCDQLTQKPQLLSWLNSYLMEYPIKEICVYRDPRDQYLSAFRNNCSSWYPRAPKHYIDYYISHTVRNICDEDKNRLILRYEDLILKYRDSVQKIIDFCGLESKNHIAPKSVFDPAISVVNIGAWKEFHDQDFMKQIEEKLGEYCYYPEKENLSDEAKKLLENRG